jgi:prepilin-type N-terminal cleavage/methylation domain-containing protein
MRRPGVTLVELLVVIAILGVVFAITGLVFTSLRAPSASAWVRELRRARDEAIRTGTPVRAHALGAVSSARARLRPPLFLPDGRALGPGADPLTGAPLDAPF